MAVYYADSSALVKRHAYEPGSAWVKTLLDPVTNHTIITARISVVEVISALNRKKRMSEINISEYRLMATDFRAIFINEYQIIEFADSIYEHACLLLETHKLRAYDSIQLASALFASKIVQASGASPLTFLAGDIDLRTAAQAEGLIVDDPQVHAP